MTNNLFSRQLILLIFSLMCLPFRVTALNELTDRTSYQNSGIWTDSISAQMKTTHLKYFGYYWSHQVDFPINYPIGGTAAVAKEELSQGYISEYHDHTNLAWSALDGSTTSDYEKLISLILRAAEFKQKMVIDISAIVYRDHEHPDIHLVENMWELRVRVREFWKAMRSARVDEHIVMIYPLDEPYLNLDRRPKGGKKVLFAIDDFFSNGDALWERLRPYYNHMEQVNQIIREEIVDRLGESIPLGAFFHSKFVSAPKVKVPSTYDWIGFSCYSDLNDCGGEKLSFEKLLARLKTKISVQDRIIYAVESWQNEGSKNPPSARKLNGRLLRSYSIANADPQFVALIPFIWRSYEQNGRFYRGARDIPEHQRRLREIGRRIKFNSGS